ncbi:unnamed protein product [Prunus armeniaca]
MKGQLELHFCLDRSFCEASEWAELQLLQSVRAEVAVLEDFSGLETVLRVNFRPKQHHTFPSEGPLPKLGMTLTTRDDVTPYLQKAREVTPSLQTAT